MDVLRKAAEEKIEAKNSKLWVSPKKEFRDEHMNEF
jgi:hypothetical protein